MSTANDALSDEVEALNSIFDNDTIVINGVSGSVVSATLRFPKSPFSFRLAFPLDYPEAPPQILGTQSTGNTARGSGEAALLRLSEVFGSTYIPGQVCLFDLVEEGGPVLEDLAAAYDHGQAEPSTHDTSERSAHDESAKDSTLMTEPALDFPAPDWATTEPLTINKSIFVGRAVRVSSLLDVENAVSHFLATNKKVAGATHNIKAWRIKDNASSPTSNLIQDYDDDGETAAGSRMLHLMQLMDAYGLVVVTRWYGGVQLGPDRFRAINNVARDALNLGGLVPPEKTKTKK
ncbi:uncharacterized protein AB675_10264 [Cyphellophora attinorum]|uniref:RWD domain-containing protein n=1 Tax=Cyphellophora attinorum TaxID=1664694 RepID=A0A0N0NJX3_9EURO|nr:uncharacterized protein AB675_10264 [Phialophora attinorum]KPI37388.1 hypothetical protein AB675_10264 [Phialophora attinorum]